MNFYISLVSTEQWLPVTGAICLVLPLPLTPTAVTGGKRTFSDDSTR